MTDDTEEAEKAIDMFKMFIEVLKDGFYKYLNKVA